MKIIKIKIQQISQTLWESLNNNWAGKPARRERTGHMEQTYKGKKYYLIDNVIYDDDMNVIIENAVNGFLDLFEYYEYFEQNEE